MKKQLTAVPFVALALFCLALAMYTSINDASDTIFQQIGIILMSAKYMISGVYWLLFAIVAMMAIEE